MSVAIGIDLGTTNTVVSAVVDGVAVTLEDDQGRRLLPSVVSFHPSGTVLVGEAARERRLIDPENTIFSIKPLLGRLIDSPEVRGASTRLPFRFTAGAKNSTSVVARDTTYALPEISAFILRRAKAIAEAALGEPVERAVITVPANFNDLQRASTKIAGKLAGLDVMRIINEPTAAALAYGQSINKNEKIAVYDLGGGTFDITLLDLTSNVFEVLATAGDTALGGDDVDRVLADKLAADVAQRLKRDPRTDPTVYGRLRFAAEEIKKELSSHEHVARTITDLGHGPGGAELDANVSVSRLELERLARPLIERTLTVARQSMDGVGLNPRDFERVILVGGSTRMPLVVRMVEDFFGQTPHVKVNPDEVVALGAAIQAHALNRSKSRPKKHTSGHDQLARAAAPIEAPKAPRLPSDLEAPPAPAFFEFTKAAAVISFSGIPDAEPARRPSPPPRPAPPVKPPPPVPRPRAATMDYGVAPDFASPLPAPELPVSSGAEVSQRIDIGAMVAPFAEFDLGSAPAAEAFARGSAIATAQAAPLLIDVTPLSLRVETVGGYSDVLIAANSPVPCEKARAFLTASDHQTVVFIRVAQGESARFGENTYLGELELSGLRPAARGEVKIQVTFELDADGILNVRAKDDDTNRETVATMRLLGTQTDAAEVNAMAARQANHVIG